MVEDNTTIMPLLLLSPSIMWTPTGISAAERSYTTVRCVDDDAKPEDFRRPGHMFPLEAKAGGVFERGGHTEGTVDLMRIAGLKEPVSAVRLCGGRRDDAYKRADRVCAASQSEICHYKSA